MHQHKINPLRDLAPPASGASGLTVLRGHQPEAWPWLVCLSHRSCVSSAITPAGNPGDHRRGAIGHQPGRELLNHHPTTELRAGCKTRILPIPTP